MSARVAWLLGLSGCDLLGEVLSDGELQVESFGSVPVDDSGYVAIDVNVPAGAVSTLAWCGGWGDEAIGTVWSVSDPSGYEVYSGYSPDAGGFRSDFLDDLVPALLPTTPELVPSEGVWRFQFYVDTLGVNSAECGAVHRVDTVSNPATVAVEFVIVSAAGLTPETAPSDPNWQAALAELEAAWQSGGVVPSYTYSAFSGDTTAYAVVDIVGDDYSEFNDLLRTRSPRTARPSSAWREGRLAPRPSRGPRSPA
jgi:hypothetical protein